MDLWRLDVIHCFVLQLEGCPSLLLTCKRVLLELFDLWNTVFVNLSLVLLFSENGSR